jgi:hypothetical protein
LKCGRRRNSRSEKGIPARLSGGVRKEDLQMKRGMRNEDLHRKGEVRKEGVG